MMGADASVGSLTTTFSPVPSCLTDIYGFNASDTYSEDSQIKTFQYTNLGPTITLDCLPSAYAPSAAYYSPGICPSGYAQACSSIISFGSNTETRATCCPLGYACQINTQNPWPWYSTEQCSGFALAGQTLHMTSSVSPGSTTTFTAPINGGLNAYGISIRYQAADFATTTSSSSSTSALLSSSGHSVISPTTSTSTTNPSANPAPGSSPSLSSGAIAGIVIGVIIWISIVTTLIFCIRRYKLRPRVPEPISEGGETYHLKYGSQYALKHHQQVVEIGEGDIRHELPFDIAPQ